MIKRSVRFLTAAFGLIELGIGVVTLAALIVSFFLHESGKPREVFIFVLVASCISSAIGLGILRRNRYARSTLLYFSFAIILSKILISCGIITLNGALETSVPQPIKNAVSIIYHSLLIAYFNLARVRKEFE